MRRSKALLWTVIALLATPLVALAAETGGGFDWWTILKPVLSIVIPLLMAWIFKIALAEVFANQKLRAAAKTIALLADDFVEDYKEKHPGAKWADIVDMVLDEFVTKLDDLKLTASLKVGDRALGAAVFRAKNGLGKK